MTTGTFGPVQFTVTHTYAAHIGMDFPHHLALSFGASFATSYQLCTIFMRPVTGRE
jgi:hypothetical protein